MTQELVLSRNRIECLIRNLAEAIKPEGVYQIKIRVDDDKIVLVPHHQPVEITLERPKA